MSDNKKYYYMRLKENFFDSNEMTILESMPDGYLYSNILLKLYLRSLKDNGKLMFNDRIPYNPQMIATITRHQVGTVEKALNIFKEMGLIDVLDNGAIYMLDIQSYIGKTSTEADRKKEYRNRIKEESKLIGQMSVQMSDKRTPEIEIDIEKELEIKKDIEKESIEEILEQEFECLWKLYPNKKGKPNALKSYKKVRTRKKNPVDYDTVANGIHSYLYYIKEMNTSIQYVKNGSTWFNQECWNDDYTVTKDVKNEGSLGQMKRIYEEAKQNGEDIF